MNMQGGERKEKWAELQEILNENNIDIIGLAETHFKEEEEPQLKPEWNYYKSNRKENEKKGGGIGVLMKEKVELKLLNVEECAEHIWCIVEPTNQRKIAICFVYMATGNDTDTWNTCIYNCVKKDIVRLNENNIKQIIIAGDFNCHIQEIDMKNTKDQYLRKLCTEFNLNIENS